MASRKKQAKAITYSANENSSSQASVNNLVLFNVFRSIYDQKKIILIINHLKGSEISNERTSSMGKRKRINDSSNENFSSQTALVNNLVLHRVFFYIGHTFFSEIIKSY